MSTALGASRSFAAVTVGEVLPPLTIDVTPTFVIRSAIATRDFQEVHHDRDLAVDRGSKDIFTNILTDAGLCVRLVTDWAGPDTFVLGTSIRLGVPNYAYETLQVGGTVQEVAPDPDGGGGRVVVAVRGRNSLGDHIVGTVTAHLRNHSRADGAR